MDQEKSILPESGFWTLQALADYLHYPAAKLQQKLTDSKVKVVICGNKYIHRLICLSEIKKLFEVKNVSEEK
jgi:hypothetical protein